MREMKINQVTGGVRVELVGVGHEKDVLLETLGSCADGSCACSSTEYEKVQSLQISSSADDITQIGRAHVSTPVTSRSRMPSSA